VVEWTVQELARRAGISGRTLRHYHHIGLLPPDRIGANGYRYYGPTAVARLARILLLRRDGLSLAAIDAVLAEDADNSSEISALEGHLAHLEREQDALQRRIGAVRHTLAMRREGREPRMDMMLEGFNDRYEAEVTERWGREVFEKSNRWWHAMSVDEQRRFQTDGEAILARWGELHRSGASPTGHAAMQHAVSHAAWFAQIPGTPGHDGDAEKMREMLIGTADLYVENPDFHGAFGGAAAAGFAAEALRHFARRP
jgi:MerR family transcriptional regulator, thiopeptide resistance regulator